MDLVEPKVPTYATPFRKMADDVERNLAVKFGGAAVLVPPGDEQPVEMLILGQEGSAMFWAALKSICQQKIDALDALERTMGSGFRR